MDFSEARQPGRKPIDDVFDSGEGAILVRSPLLRQLHAVSQEYGDQVATDGREGALNWRDAGMRLLETSVSAAGHGLLPLDDESTARLLLALRDVVVRDAACMMGSSGPEDPLERLLSDLVLRAPAWFGAPAAAALSFVRWRRGDTRGAVRAGQLALNHDPKEGLALVVLQAAEFGLDPRSWPDEPGRERRVRRSPRKGARRRRKAALPSRQDLRS